MSVLHRLTLDEVHVVFTDRRGGNSTGAYAGSNLARHVGDDPSTVARNRAEVSEELGIANDWVEVEQVHGCDTVVVSDRRASGVVAQADAIVCTVPEVPVAVFTADCVPIVLIAQGSNAFAVVHAGWRGLLAGVVERAVWSLSRVGSVAAAIAGPSIGRCCYTVGADLLEKFEARFGSSVLDRTARRLDLSAAALQAVEEAAKQSTGQVPLVLDLGPCTACSEQLFSYRRQQGMCGRQGTLVWRSVRSGERGAFQAQGRGFRLPRGRTMINDTNGCATRP